MIYERFNKQYLQENAITITSRSARPTDVLWVVA